MFCIVSPLGCFALYENVSITTYIAGIFHRGKVLSLLPKFYFYWELIYSHDGVYHGFHTLPTILLLCVDSGPCGGTKSKLFTRRLQLLEGHLCQSLPQTSEQFIHTHTHTYKSIHIPSLKIPSLQNSPLQPNFSSGHCIITQYGVIVFYY